MADISDVEAAFVAALTAAIYPNGNSSPSAITLPGGSNPACRIFAGWPLPETLDADLAAGNINVSVFTQSGMEQNTTRYPREWQNQITVPCSMTGAISGRTITIGGAVTAGHYLTIHVGNSAYSYIALATDTTATIAAALTALMTVNIVASASGSVITVPAVMGGRIIVRGAAPGTAVMELERSRQRFMITVWAPNNAGRVAASKVVRPALAAIDYFNLPDGYVGELKYESSTDVDRSGKQNLSCRDIYYWVEYPTTQTAVAYPMTTFSGATEVDTTSTVITPLPLSSFTPARTVIT